MSGDSATKLPALLTPGVTNGTGTGYKQTKHDTSPPRGHSKESLPQLAPKQEADDEHGHGSIFSTGKASIDQFLLELVDPCHKGLVRFVDFAWLHVRLMYYHGRNASIQERLQSLGGTYPQQVFRRFDVDQDNHLDKVEWQEYASSLIAVLGKAYLKDACKGLLREQHEAEAKKEGPLTWRYDDQASRQLLDKVSCAMHLGRDQEDVIEGLLKKFADPNYGDRHGQTVLWHAATKCEAHCMARLLEHGGSACAAGQDLDSPVLAAARARKLQVVRLLLLNDLVETGAENEEIVSTNLIDKAAELTSKEVKDLIHRGANINYRNDRGWTPLTAAVFWNNHDYVECLVRLPHKTARSALQADLPDSRGRTALHVAARKGLSDLVPLILGARANQDARDGDGWTALHHAVFNGHTDTVLKLLDGAADPRVQLTSIHWEYCQSGVQMTATLSVPEKFEKSRVLCHAFNSERSSPPAPLSIWISFALMSRGVRGFSANPQPPAPQPEAPTLNLESLEEETFQEPWQKCLAGLDIGQCQQIFNSLSQEQKD
eukprot:symbB.v1.2.027570.t2/scaffold2838.1/size69213/11